MANSIFKRFQRTVANKELIPLIISKPLMIAMSDAISGEMNIFSEEERRGSI
ncbi:hypothetical protein [Methanolobus sp. WCC5]|uniref:hypothetical protein n=1 Tax=Methanolobus sp. WCC5 TaxID=3125785 RepID=UPI00325210DE